MVESSLPTPIAGDRGHVRLTLAENDVVEAISRYIETLLPDNASVHEVTTRQRKVDGEPVIVAEADVFFDLDVRG